MRFQDHLPSTRDRQSDWDPDIPSSTVPLNRAAAARQARHYNTFAASARAPAPDMSTGTKIGHGLAKVLGIKLEGPNDRFDPTTRGESLFSVSSADTYVEHEPTVGEWLSDLVPSPRQIGRYFYNLFPFIHWIGRYNLQWLAGDLIAGMCLPADRAKGTQLLTLYY